MQHASLSWYFACVVINLFETSHIGSMNTNHTCSRQCHYDAGMTVCRPSSDMEKDGLKCGAEERLISLPDAALAENPDDEASRAQQDQWRPFARGVTDVPGR
jgi:hypothetical protein